MTIKIQEIDKKWLQKYDEAYNAMYKENKDIDKVYIDSYAFGQLLGYSSALMEIYNRTKTVAALALYDNFEVAKEIIVEYERLRKTLSQDESYKDKTPIEIEGIAKGLLEIRLETINSVYQFMDNNAIHKYFHYDYYFVAEVANYLRETRYKLIENGVTYKR